MKAALKIALAASLAAGVTAQPHNHQHLHQHARKHQHGAPLLSDREALDKRYVEIEYAYETETDYVDVADGSHISADAAEQGLADGIYKIVGETTPTSTTPTTTPAPTTSSSSSTSAAPTTAPTTSSANGGEFLELKIAGLHTSSTSSAAPAATTSASSSSSSSSSGATGVDADFPDGELDCSTFPSDYGAVFLDNTGLSTGWAGYMDVGVDNFEIGQTADISIDISEPSGEVKSGYFLTYACPPGYDSAQWPGAQGSKGQSVGGIWCGSDNKLHLTRSDKTKKLCQSGAGNVKVTNKLSEDVYICKTIYPGNEGMYLPTLVEAGATVDLYNPYQSDSFVWEGLSTSAQYYINKKGLDVNTSCTWTPDAPYSTSAGNWAPMNLGTSVNADGETFLSIFHNTPTSSASLDFDIAISGDDVNGTPCKYDSSTDETTGGSNGCTVSLGILIPHPFYSRDKATDK